MRIWEDDKWKTAFRIKYGHFKYQVMRFSLFNAPASFQGYINKIFAKKLDIFVFVYWDNILIYTDKLGQPYVKTIQWVLKQLQKYGLFANLKKCQFHEYEVWFWVFIVSAQEIKMEEKRIEAVKR